MNDQATVGPDRLLGLEIGGKYKIVRVLGEGGMGCVYQGEQKLGATIRKVAIKTLHEHLSHDTQILARFEREVGTVAGLQHPNTIQVFDFGKMDDGTLYIVMEFVEGKSVAGVLETSGPMDPPRVVNILKQVCGSLEEAHGLGIVHRDLKPDNVVLCDKAGTHDWVEVLDFGIAKRSSEVDEREQKLTQQGMVLGTPPYMSPEQFTGKPVDRRSDIYSLAVMAYEMLTGGLPFTGNTAWEWATAHMTAQPRPLETFPVSGRIPPAMKAAILRALEKDPNRRFPTVTEFFNAFSSNDMSAGISAPVYPRGATQSSAPIDPHAMGMSPVPVAAYQTGQQAYGTPPHGSHTYTPQPFPQTPPPHMMTPPPVSQEKSGSKAGLVVALLGFLVLAGGLGIAAYSRYGGKVGSGAGGADTNRVASTAQTNAATAATTTPITSDTGAIEPLAVGSSKPTNTSAFVGPATPTLKKDAGAATSPTMTAPTYTTEPVYTAPPTYTTAPTYPPQTYPTYPQTYPTYPPPPRPPNGREPAECNAARTMRNAGAERQAAQLAARCVQLGGRPPF